LTKTETLFETITKVKRVRRVAQVVKHLSKMFISLSSIPSTAKIQNPKTTTISSQVLYCMPPQVISVIPEAGAAR
jgi:hypothetical protein